MVVPIRKSNGISAWLVNVCACKQSAIANNPAAGNKRFIRFLLQGFLSLTRDSAIRQKDRQAAQICYTSNPFNNQRGTKCQSRLARLPNSCINGGRAPQGPRTSCSTGSILTCADWHTTS